MATDELREARAYASEIKFLVPSETGAAIRDWARRHLRPDPHGDGEHGDEYRTTTIYFDNPDYDVFHRRRSFGRCKYRIRRYNAGPDVFLERKLRRPGMVSKRRTTVPLDALSSLSLDEAAGWEGEWFRRRLSLRRLRPVCEISYHRVARTAASVTGTARFTLDDRLEVGGANAAAFTAGSGQRMFAGRMILELKYQAGAPALFKQLVEEFRLEAGPLSKYRTGLQVLEPAMAIARLTALEVHS